MITEAFSHDNDTLKWIDYNDLYCARKIEKFIAWSVNFCINQLFLKTNYFIYKVCMLIESLFVGC